MQRIGEKQRKGVTMYRILVADDEVNERALIRFLLSDFINEELKLYEAKNGKEALTIIQQNEIDILISDIQMGLMTGIELATKVREIYPDLEILFISGYDDFEYVRSALSLRAVNYILKPVNPEELKKSLTEIIERLDSKSLQFVKSKQYIEKKFYGETEKQKTVYRSEIIEGMEKQEKNYSELDAVLMKEIEAAIFMKNSEALRSTVNELLARYNGETPRSHIYIRYICISLLQQLMQQLPFQRKEFEEATEKIFMFQSFSDIEEVIHFYLEQVISEMEREANSSNYVIYQVKQYIDFHYQENLELNQLADHVFLSSAIPVFSVILMMNFFRGIPKSLEEAAFIDGATSYQVLIKIMVPCAKPSIATISLFSIVGSWNDFFSGLIYLQKIEKYPIMTYIQSLSINIQQLIEQGMMNQSTLESIGDLSNKNLNAAKIIVAVVPLLIIYPLLQRYLISGMVMGSVKE